MTLATEMQAALLATNFEEFGEEIVYNKFSDSSTRTIKALVHRGQVFNTEGVLAPGTEFEVINNSTDGVSTAEIDTGKDTFTINERFDATAPKTLYFRIVDDDQVVLTLEVK